MSSFGDRPNFGRNQGVLLSAILGAKRATTLDLEPLQSLTPALAGDARESAASV
jgi:hypothetical protein